MESAAAKNVRFTQADTTAPTDLNIRADLLEKGAVLVPQVLSVAEVLKLLQTIREISGLQDEDANSVFMGDRRAFVAPGLVARRASLWPVMVNERLLGTLRVICPGVVSLPGIDSVFVHHSVTEWHRDTSLHLLPKKFPNETWLRSTADYAVMRVIFYLHDSGQSHSFLFLPGSHLNGDLRLRESSDDAVGSSFARINITPGDCVIFDPRVIHAGERPRSPKYAIVLTFGAPNLFSLETYLFSHLVSIDQNFPEPSPSLLQFLREAHLAFDGFHDPGARAKYATIWSDIPRGDPYRIRRKFSTAQ